MTIRKSIFRLGLTLFLFILSTQSVCAKVSFADFAFEKVKNNRVELVKSLIDKGYSIDAVNSEGLTALCQSVQAKDYETYRRLRRLGASAEHKCMQKQDTKIVNKFALQYSPEITVSKASVLQEKSQNLEKYEKLILGTVLAAAAVGTGVVAIEQNDDDDTQIKACDEGFLLVGNECIPNTAPPCREGFELVDGKCQFISCPDGYILEGNDCVSICSDDQVWNGNACVSPQQCPAGQRWDGTQCVVIVCPENTHLVGDTCVADGNLNFTYVGDDNLYGVNSEDEDVYNLYSVPSKPKDEATITLSNKGNGNAYGVYGISNVTNSFAVGEVDDVVNTGKNIGNISITSEGRGSTYGLYSKIEDIKQYKEAINARSINSGIALGNINITHRGGGDAYGVFGDVRAYNAFAAYGGKSFGNITIRGDGDIYGISGYVAATNAVSPFFGSRVLGNIDLYQYGNRDVYGMMVNKADIPGAGAGDGNTASWFAFNAYASGGDIVEGNLNIRNMGDGNAYGMYGGRELYNAMSYGGRDETTGEPNGIARGQINILNVGNGNSYGMYLPEADAKGLIANINSNGSESVINMVNVGSGTATGMRGGAETTILNSGKIDINNLGSGTAIGIYGEKNSRIENSGSINIHRDTYTDTESNEVYSPTSVSGGTAYGIYAESGANVINRGEITITGAKAGEGIHLEDGATLVNRGTVRFNGVLQNGNDGIENAVNFNEMGGEVLLGQGGRFFAKELSGKLGVSKTTVMDSFENEYVVSGALQAKDVSKLDVYSKSAMFTAAKKDDSDVVLSRKELKNVLENDALGKFFDDNYNQKNGVEVFNVLKQAETEAELNTASANMTGVDVLPNFRKENALVYRHLSRQFNDNLFNRPDENYIGGYKYIDVSMDKDGVLTGSDGKVNAAYGMLKGKTDNGIVYGLGATVAHLESDYDNGANRKSNIFGLWAPIGYDFKNGTQLYSKFYAGYADGSYDRKTQLGKYSADTKEYQYGMSNELRHKLSLGKGFTFEPLAELNLLGIYQDKFNEGTAAGALHIDSGNSISVEGGLGAYLSKEMIFNDDNKLGIQIGGVYYVEFLDSEDGVDAAMSGMSGKYRIKHKAQDDYAVFSLRANYTYKNLMLYAVIEQETGGNKAFSIDTGVQYKF
ncbi:MAG: autotransporter domain-containing protein [Acetobacter sp.]|nr:autotransporter domain-containing protein [Acetobacter sp.]